MFSTKSLALASLSSVLISGVAAAFAAELQMPSAERRLQLKATRLAENGDAGSAEESPDGGLRNPLSKIRGELSGDELLTDIRDTRLSLMQVKQQAVNVFMEATRTLVTTKEPALEHTPQEINAAMYDPKHQYLPPRKEWLVYFVTTLEPIIHLMTEDLKDAEQNGIRAPEPIRAKVRPLWQDWRAQLLSINKSLDELQSSIGPDSGTNEGIAKAALNIYDGVTHLEKLRYQAAVICREELVKMEKEKASK